DAGLPGPLDGDARARLAQAQEARITDEEPALEPRAAAEERGGSAVPARGGEREQLVVPLAGARHDAHETCRARPCVLGRLEAHARLGVPSRGTDDGPPRR